MERYKISVYIPFILCLLKNILFNYYMLLNFYYAVIKEKKKKKKAVCSEFSFITTPVVNSA